MNFIAEGVETARALEILVETGYDLAQGYYLARPQPADRLTAVTTTSILVPRTPRGAVGFGAVGQRGAARL
jgi:predicted signal transduction protein with EAL and GGDEF domain